MYKIEDVILVKCDWLYISFYRLFSKIWKKNNHFIYYFSKITSLRLGIQVWVYSPISERIKGNYDVLIGPIQVDDKIELIIFFNLDA